MLTFRADNFQHIPLVGLLVASGYLGEIFKQGTGPVIKLEIPNQPGSYSSGLGIYYNLL